MEAMWCISLLTIQTVIHCILYWPSLVFMDDRVDKVGSCISAECYQWFKAT